MKTMNKTKGTLVLLFCALSAACSSSEVRVVKTQPNEVANVGIGFIENRDVRFNPFSSKNFTDMLGFELMERGYQIGEVDYEVLSKPGDAERKVEPEAEEKEPAPAEEASEESGDEMMDESGDDGLNDTDTIEEEPSADEETAPVGGGDDENTYAGDAGLVRTDESVVENSRPARRSRVTEDGYIDAYDPKQYDATYDLLPRRLRDIAGETRAPERVVQPDARRLSAEEIQRISGSSQLDYFIQGAIGRTETGLLLEVEENTLVFLEIFDPQGRRVGAVNFVIDNETLKRASFLQEISQEIAKKFHAQIHGGVVE